MREARRANQTHGWGEQHMPMNTAIPHQVMAISQRMAKVTGMSAIELLTVLSILSLLMALAVPGFQSLIERWRVQQAVEAMKSTLYYARSEAVKRGGRIGIQKTPTTPTAAAWLPPTKNGVAAGSSSMTATTTAHGTAVKKSCKPIPRPQKSTSFTTLAAQKSRWIGTAR